MSTLGARRTVGDAFPARLATADEHVIGRATGESERAHVDDSDRIFDGGGPTDLWDGSVEREDAHDVRRRASAAAEVSRLV